MKIIEISPTLAEQISNLRHSMVEIEFWLKYEIRSNCNTASMPKSVQIMQCRQQLGSSLAVNLILVDF